MKSAYDRIAQKSIPLQEFSPKKLTITAETLERVISNALESGKPDEETDMGDALRLLSRLCARHGKPVPLPELQNPASGNGFISDPQARFSELTRKWGYDIPCHVKRVGGETHSVRWIVLGPDGRPKVDHSAPKRQNQPQAAPRTTPAELPFLVAARKSIQPSLELHSLADVRKFVSYETGVR